MSDVNIPIDGEFEAMLAERIKRRREQNTCHITIEPDGISMRFDEPLPEGPHKVTRLETMVSGALLGIARTLTGRGEDAVLAAMEQFDRKVKARAKR